MDDFPKLDKLLQRRSEVIVRWCEEWRFGVDASVEYEDEEEGSQRRRGSGAMKVPAWDEIVEKCEELMWMATVSLVGT